MSSVYGCFTGQHDMLLVGVAVVICLLATVAAVSLVDHARARAGRVVGLWLGLAAATGGVGIWATHFVAMLAFQSGLPSGYKVGLTVCSLLGAVLFAAAGFGLTIGGTRARHAVLGGGVLGLGIAVMHFGGMAAFEVAGRFSWNGALVAASILFAVGLGAAALWVGQRPWRFRQSGSAILLSAAICIHHFAAMGALTIHPDPTVQVPVNDIPARILALPVALASTLVLLFALLSLAADIWTRNRALAENDRMRTLADAAVEGLLICDGTAVVTANTSFAALAGVGAAEVAGQPLRRFIPDDAMLDRLLRHPGRSAETELATRSGAALPVELIVHDIHFAGRPHQAIAVRDLRSRKLAEERIRFLAHHDVLTGLPNRAWFNAELDDAIEAARAEGRGLALLCLDLDRFKEVNDLFGHLAGDEVLQSLARIVSGLLKGSQAVARLGGDEFAILMPDGVDAVAVGRVAEAILNQVAQHGAAVRAGPAMGTSIGIALFPGDGGDRQSLLNAADTALYRAKAEGRGTFKFYETGMGAQLRDRRRLENDLRSAVARCEMSLVFQPQMLVETGAIVGFEALLRWHHPERGPVSPGLFIPIAEDSGAILSIGEWVLRAACAEAASWRAPLRVAVNVSAVQLHAPGFADLVEGVLAETGIDPRRLELEVTETALIRDFNRALATLRRLKALGVKVAMDDFGTGYSSLSNLRAFPFDRIKIDGSFIQAVDSNSQAAAIVRAILELGRGLGLSILAEGVETAAELGFLDAEFCQEVQGYLTGRPAPIACFVAATQGGPKAHDSLAA